MYAGESNKWWNQSILVNYIIMLSIECSSLWHLCSIYHISSKSVQNADLHQGQAWKVSFLMYKQCIYVGESNEYENVNYIIIPRIECSSLWHLLSIYNILSKSVTDDGWCTKTPTLWPKRYLKCHRQYNCCLIALWCISYFKVKDLRL